MKPKQNNKLMLEKEMKTKPTYYGGGHSKPNNTGKKQAEPLTPTLQKTLPDTGIVRIITLTTSQNSWNPTIRLAVQRSQHPLDTILSQNILHRIQKYCQQPPDTTIAFSPRTPSIQIKMRNLKH
jgi:hypothetical protein